MSCAAQADGADLSFQAVLADLAMKSHKQRSWDRCWTAVQRYHAQQLAAAGNLHRSNSLIRCSKTGRVMLFRCHDSHMAAALCAAGLRCLANPCLC